MSEAPAPNPETSADTEPLPGLAAIAEWLERTALRGVPAAELVAGLNERLVAAGVPLARSTALVDTLHPVHEGTALRWFAENDGAETLTYDRGYDETMWQSTAFYHLERSGLPFYRTPLQAGEAPEFASLTEFRDEGYRDYLVVVERFEDSGSVGEMTCIYTSWLTRSPEGFSEAAIATIRRLSPVLALALKCLELHEISQTIAQTYLGRNAAQRVLQGSILRGRASEIEAVLWSSDLMSFTAHSEAMGPDELIPFLNAYSGALVTAVESEGGDVLKFMGDGLLAIFPVEGDPAFACRAALRAEAEARRLVGFVNEKRAETGRRTTDFYLALHLGRVYFGNIGSAERLDFTVIGPAVNEATRIMTLCSGLRRNLLLSSRFAEAVAGPNVFGSSAAGADDLPLASVGRFALKGVSEAQHLYTLA